MKRSLLLAFLVPLALAAPASAKCDNLDPAVCLQPFPNNFFTKPSTKTDTGLKVNFALTDMPRNAAGKPIQPGQWNRNDGFSPGSLITTLVPGLDLAKTHGHRRHRRADAGAQPHLDRDGLARVERIRPQPDRAAGTQLPRGPHLHRRAAQPQGQQWRSNPGR